MTGLEDGGEGLNDPHDEKDVTSPRRIVGVEVGLEDGVGKEDELVEVGLFEVGAGEEHRETGCCGFACGAAVGEVLACGCEHGGNESHFFFFFCCIVVVVVVVVVIVVVVSLFVPFLRLQG